MKREELEKAYKQKEEIYINYIKENIEPTPELDEKFKDGTSMYEFRYNNHNKLIQNKEYLKIIKEKENKNQIKEEINKLKEKEKNILLSNETLNKKLKNLTDIEKLVLYRECLEIPEDKNTYQIKNITLSKEELKTLKEIYLNCYATYIEKEKYKRNDIITEKIEKPEIEILEYLNAFLTKSNWNMEKIDILTSIFNKQTEELKSLAIKYRYLSFFTDNKNLFKLYKNTLNTYTKAQVEAYTQSEIKNVKIPQNFKHFLDYEKGNKGYWKNIEGIKGLPIEEIAKIIINIQTKSNIYKENKENEKTKEQEINKLEQIEKKNQKEEEKQTAMIDANYYIALFIKQRILNEIEFCQINNIELEYFNSLVKITKKNNKELYSKYINIINLKQQEIYQKEIKEIKNIINNIKLGITENGATREYDIIDLYNETTLSAEEILHIISYMNLSPDDTRAIKSIIGTLQKTRPITEEEVLEIEHKILENDGTMRTITLEEKQKILNYIKNKNIPLLEKTYNLALKKYLNNTLNLEQTKKIRKK